MIDCQSFSFSQRLSTERLKKARSIFGTKIIDRILCFALFLLGVNRTNISKALNAPPGSVRSTIRALLNSGVSALEDRRHSASTFLPYKEEKNTSVGVQNDANDLVIDFGSSFKLNIPRTNTIQVKTVLLSIVNNGLISARKAGEVLNFSTGHIRILAHKLKTEDATAFIDKRQGPRQDYVFSPEIKAEVIQQFSANAAVRTKTSSNALAKDIKARCGLDLSPRTIRFHMDKLGLSKIRQTLPKLIETFKKNSKA